MAKRKPKQPTVQQQLIEHILNADINQAELCRQTGIPHSNISSFLHGNRGLSLDAINRICMVLGLNLVNQGEN